MQKQKPSHILGRTTVSLLLGIVILLAVVPLLLHPESAFGGADTAAKQALTDRGVEPWFEPLFEPPGTETESLLFALQAGAGAGVIGYFLGLKRGEARASRRDDNHEDDA
jgi:cobalt/nickel transport protein